jgi:hypothetical protein
VTARVLPMLSAAPRLRSHAAQPAFSRAAERVFERLRPSDQALLLRIMALLANVDVATLYATPAQEAASAAAEAARLPGSGLGRPKNS